MIKTRESTRKTERKTRESTRKTERKTAKKVSMTRHSRCLENLNPTFTKKGPGRYHVQGKQQ